jgi:ligand-binding sensor domain-containing protein/two-component sensor histidine kinase
MSRVGKKCTSFLLAWLTLCSLQSYAQEITHHYKKYGTEEGLPSSEVYEILQDKTGHIWFCTDAGVARFNGYEFQSFTTDDGLTDNTIFHLYEDVNGRIWFLPFNSQLCYFENDSIYPYRHNEQLKQVIPAEWIRTISIDSFDNIVFVARRYGHGTISQKGEINYRSNSNDTGLVAWLEHYNQIMVYGLKAEAKRQAFDLFELNNTVQTIPYEDPIQATQSIYQYAIGKGEFIFGVGGNTCYYKNGKLKILTTNQVLQNLHIDQHGRVWLAYFNDGIKLYGSVGELFSGNPPVNHLFPKKNISCIFEDNTKGMWLAIQNNGVYYISNSNIEVFTLSNSELTNRVSAICKDENNIIFTGTFNSKVYQINNDTVHLIHENILGNNITISSINVKNGAITPFEQLLAQDGTRWTVGNWTLRSIKNNDTLFFPLKQEKFLRFNAIYEDNQGQIWAGSNNGLHQFKAGQLQSLTNVSKLLDIRVEDIDQLKDGTLLIATKGNGLVFFKENQVSNIDQRNGLISNILRDIHVDEEENIWLSTPNGINRLVKKEKGNFEVTTLTTIHGLPSNEINEIVSVGSVIWAATNRGVARFNKNDVGINTVAPKLHFNRILLNEKESALKSSYQMPHHQNSIEISFAGLSYRNSGKINYRYRLKGIDNDWIISQSRTVRYPSLPHGNYTFEVQAANEDGVWSDSKTIAFTIHPPFWVTWWFITVCIFVLIIIVFSFFRFREIRQRKKEAQARILAQQKLLATKSELKALRAQMNPHFTFNTLSAIQTAVNNSDAKSASKYIVNFATLIRKVLENSKHATIKLEEEIEMLRLYIELEQLRFSNRFDYQIKVDKNLDSDFMTIPSMIIQPYIENAIIHGLAPKTKDGQLSVELKLENSFLHCIIQDNGVGREEAQKIKARKGLVHHSMAMEITEDRLDLYQQELGKEFTVEIIDLKDKNGQASGTKVQLIFPV